VAKPTIYAWFFAVICGMFKTIDFKSFEVLIKRSNTMRIILLILVLGFIPVLTSSAQAQSLCEGSTTVPSPALLSHFSPGGVSAPLGELSLRAFARECNSVTGCTEWAPSDTQLMAGSSSIWKFPGGSNLAQYDGYGAVALPKETQAQLLVVQGKINLNLNLGVQSSDGTSAFLTTSIEYNSAVQNFSSDSSGDDFFGQDYHWMFPTTSTSPPLYCDRADGSCLIGYSYSSPELDVKGMKNVAPTYNRLQSVRWGSNCFEAIYQEISPAVANGSHQEGQIWMNGSF
jgi:hypothetical protein